jgi:crotonobetainyl-CoA:carnitine CoA-transferase CaiB-like acyl-CoA transferase
MEQCINESTSQLENVALAERLQAAGVAAIPTFNGEELYSLPHLWAREAFTTVVHPLTGQSVTLSGPAWKFSETPAAVRGARPVLGEHNDYVFGEILGLPREEIERLTDAGALK